MKRNAIKAALFTGFFVAGVAGLVGITAWWIAAPTAALFVGARARMRAEERR